MVFEIFAGLRATICFGTAGGGRFCEEKVAEVIRKQATAGFGCLICHNEETRLLSCLWSLCDNECDFPIEILAVNNNSTDRTEAVMQQLG